MKKRRRRRSIVIPDCTHFTGYRPCFPGEACLEKCVDPRPRGTRILIVNLEAMGNVLVTTTLLPAIRRRYPKSTISWITLPNAAPLLEGNPSLHRVYVWGPESRLVLQGMKFDLVMNVDKSVHAGAFVKSLNATKSLGYGIDENGVIIPLNRAAEEYVLRLSEAELEFCRAYRRELDVSDGDFVVGLNTGCSPLYPNKKMTVDQHAVLVELLSALPGVRLLLLGGPEDTERNAEIARRVRTKAVSTPTTEGLRRGLCYINLCNAVISGDSFGMHAAIGLKKYVIVWFGVSCPQEVDLFDRGLKLVPEGLECSPCWKRTCPYNVECIQVIDLERMVEEVRRLSAGARQRT